MKCKVSQNTTSFIGVNEITCFDLLGEHHQVCKVIPTYVTRIDLPIRHPDPPPNTKNDRTQGDDPRPGYHTQTHVHRRTCSHAVYVSYIIYKPDDEISTSATHKQYLVS